MRGAQPWIRGIVVVAVVVVAAVIYMERPAIQGADSAVATPAGLPRLLDLGADKCVPCKMMAPILDELKIEFAGVFEVEFIDVWKTPGAAESHGVKIIPTQIFYAADGRELARHEGFFSREDILAKWRELGVDPGGA